MERNPIVYIIGFMGSGKTTAGKVLAELLGWSFIDVDKNIETYAGKTISEIFSENGEDYFRQLERQLLRDSGSAKNTVISTGGGAPCFSDNMDFMLKTGLTIYLKLSPLELKERLLAAKEERPLIKGLDPSGLESFIIEKLGSREKWYEQSEITIPGYNLDNHQLLEIVKSKLKF